MWQAKILRQRKNKVRKRAITKKKKKKKQNSRHTEFGLECRLTPERQNSLAVWTVEPVL